MIDVIYNVIGGVCFIAGVIGGALMWRNALVWRGRKMFLRALSGTTCLIVAFTFAVMLLLDLPNESYLATLVLRPAWMIMLALAASFSIADL